MADAPVERRGGWNPDHRLEWTPVDASEFDLVDPYPPPEPRLWWRVRTSIAGFGGPVLVMAALVAGAQVWILKDDTPDATPGIVRTAGAEKADAVARTPGAAPASEASVQPRSATAPRETAEAVSEATVRVPEPAHIAANGTASSPPPLPTVRDSADAGAPAATVRAERSPTPPRESQPPAPTRSGSLPSALSARTAPVSDPPSVRPRPAPAAQQQAARAAADGRGVAPPTAGVEPRALALASRMPEPGSARSMPSTRVDPAPDTSAASVTPSREAARVPAAGTASQGVTPPPPRADSTESASAATAAAGNAAAPPAAVSARRLAEQQIEDTLSRFEAAYESLDADAASRIWPGVDRRALARAFHGLRSQEITFTRCRMAIETVAASVDCDGWTTFVPRIGSQDPRTEERRWNFQLRKRGETWTIAEARVR